MDLRPKLAREFAEAIYDDMIVRGLSDAPEVRDPIVEGWVDLILKRFVSHSIDIEDNHVSTRNPEACAAFLEKYPRLQELIDLAKAEALRRWPEATFHLELISDPECGHITHEGQHLTLEIQTGLAFRNEEGEFDGSPYDVADDEWLEWRCSDGSAWQLKERELGDVAFLLLVDLRWREEDEE